MADKVLAITGGASGIGLAIAQAALGEGRRVAVADRDEAALGRSRGALCPGPVETPLVARLHGPETRAQWLRHPPMRRCGSPEEITPMALFPLDERQSGYLTGQAIAVDGGYAAAGPMPPVD